MDDYVEFGSLDLGLTDCDTCGVMWDEVRVAYWDDDDGYEFCYTFGCYGGEQFYEADKATFIERLEARRRQFPVTFLDIIERVRAHEV
jgi:hypothetical protein